MDARRNLRGKSRRDQCGEAGSSCQCPRLIGTSERQKVSLCPGEVEVVGQGAQRKLEKCSGRSVRERPFVCLVLVKEANMTTTHSRRQFETLNQAAERTGLSVRTLRRRIAAGLLPAYRSGPRVLRVDPADVDRLMVRVPTA